MDNQWLEKVRKKEKKLMDTYWEKKIKGPMDYRIKKEVEKNRWRDKSANNGNTRKANMAR